MVGAVRCGKIATMQKISYRMYYTISKKRHITLRLPSAPIVVWCRYVTELLDSMGFGAGSYLDRGVGGAYSGQRGPPQLVRGSVTVAGRPRHRIMSADDVVCVGVGRFVKGKLGLFSLLVLFLALVSAVREVWPDKAEAAATPNADLALPRLFSKGPQVQSPFVRSQRCCAPATFGSSRK